MKRLKKKILNSKIKEPIYFSYSISNNKNKTPLTIISLTLRKKLNISLPKKPKSHLADFQAKFFS